MRYRLLLIAGLTAVMCGQAWAAGSTVFRDGARLFSMPARQSIDQAAQQARFRVTVWTVNSAFPNKAQFSQMADRMVSRDSVVIAIDPPQHYSDIAAARSTGLDPQAVREAKSLADSHFHTGDWAGGVASAIQALSGQAGTGNGGVAGGAGMGAGTAGSMNAGSNSIGSGSMGVGSSPMSAPGAPSPGGHFSFAMLAFAIAVIVVLLIIARRLTGRGGAAPMVGPMGGGYGPSAGYGPGGAPGYPMGQGYGSRPGINPLVAGGLGAAGGGLLGYELGKMAGENEERNLIDNQGMPANQNYDSGTGQQDGVVDANAGQGNGPDWTDAGSQGGSDSGVIDTGGDFGGGDFGGGDSGGSGGDF